MSPQAGREGRAISPIANTNLIHAKTLLPQLRGDVPVGETVLMTAVMALPNGQAAAQAVRAPPAPVAVHDLEELLRMKGCAFRFSIWLR
ncbi:hypothetical protein [Bradyrhizobium sp.]|uniref:DUF2264 C-terminal domain-containing protein n=1 Tax=Bradyrhizobium sp. TaxID=376 RepID=UPI002CAFDFFB|nr:hypothetical protein [Bradyrhizobium sp.]HWX64002.1 hypothetical protein [Bradyrhizobium sp.]